MEENRAFTSYRAGARRAARHAGQHPALCRPRSGTRHDHQSSESRLSVLAGLGQPAHEPGHAAAGPDLLPGFPVQPGHHVELDERPAGRPGRPVPGPYARWPALQQRPGTQQQPEPAGCLEAQQRRPQLHRAAVRPGQPRRRLLPGLRQQAGVQPGHPESGLGQPRLHHADRPVRPGAEHLVQHLDVRLHGTPHPVRHLAGLAPRPGLHVVQRRQLQPPPPPGRARPARPRHYRRRACGTGTASYGWR